MIEGKVRDYNHPYQLLTAYPFGSTEQLRVAHASMAIGQTLRVKVQARDISLSLSPGEHSSILNSLRVTVVGETPADNQAHVLVRLDGGTALLARMSRYSRTSSGCVSGSRWHRSNR